MSYYDNNSIISRGIIPNSSVSLSLNDSWTGRTIIQALSGGGVVDIGGGELSSPNGLSSSIGGLSLLGDVRKNKPNPISSNYNSNPATPARVN